MTSRLDQFGEILTPAERKAVLPSAGCEAAAIEADPELDVPVDPELARAHRDTCEPCRRREAGADGLN